ncbi:MAG: hypothetical protein ABIO76_01715 [Ginsengibacter sp.]
MRNFLLFLCIVISNKIIAQVPMVMPPEADAFYEKAMPIIKPQLKKVIAKAANSLKNRHANADSLFIALHSNSVLKGMSDKDMQGLTTLIMVQASKNADEDIKKMVLGMRNKDDAEFASNENSNNSKQLILQMIVQRKSQMAEEISFVMKKIYNEEDTIINSLK